MSEEIEQEIRTLRSLFWSDRDPEGLAFAPLADAYRRAGEFRQAMELLSNGRVRHPDFATGHLAAARLFMEKELQEEAELAARRVLELDDENVLALGLLADTLEGHGDALAAQSLRRRVRELTEVGAPARAEEAVVDIAELAPDEPARAEEAVVDIADLAPDEPARAEEAVVDIADLAPDEPARADEAEQAEEADFADDGLLVTRTMADLYARQGFVTEALEVYRQLIQFDPEDPELGRKIATLEAVQTGEDEGHRGPARERTSPGPERQEEEEVAEHVWQTQAQEEGHDVDTPFAWIVDESEESVASSPPISAYFQRLLAWVPAASDTGPASLDDSGDARAGEDGGDSRNDSGEDDL